MKTKQELLLNVRQNIRSLELIDPQFIIKYPQDYKEIVITAIWRNSEALKYVNKQYMIDHPQCYKEIVSKAVRKSVHALRDVNRAYILNNPDDYKAIMIDALEERELAFDLIDKDFKEQHPTKYGEIAVALLKRNPTKFLFFNCQKEFLDKHSEQFKILALTAIQIMPSLFYNLNATYIKDNPTAFREIAVAAIKRERVLLEAESIKKITREDPTCRKIYAALKQLTLRSFSLEQRGFQHDGQVANNLCADVLGQLLDYKAQKITGEEFKKQCALEITNARPTLEKHRGLKQILGNLMLAVLGLGAGYCIAGLINLVVTKGQHFFFQFETETGKKIDELEDVIQQDTLNNYHSTP